MNLAVTNIAKGVLRKILVAVPTDLTIMKGFTLIELIIYISLVAVFLTILFSFVWQLVFADIKSQSIREVSQNNEFIFNKIESIAGKAVSVNSPLAAQSASSISLEMANSNENPTVFSFSDGALFMSQGSAGPWQLNSNQVTVKDCVFTNISYPDTPGTIKLDLLLARTNLNNDQRYDASLGSSISFSLRSGGGFVQDEGSCQGIVTNCNSYADQTFCTNQEGCSWMPGQCQGICTPCSQLNRQRCSSQNGCSWSFLQRRCEGTCTACGTFLTLGSCQGQRGCSWIPEYCFGTAIACQEYSIESACNAQDGCNWVIP